MLPLLTLLESVDFESFRRRIPRSVLLAQVGISGVRFNDLISRRAELTQEEERKLTDLIPLKSWELFRAGPSRLSRWRAGLAAREQRAVG